MRSHCSGKGTKRRPTPHTHTHTHTRTHTHTHAHTHAHTHHHRHRIAEGTSLCCCCLWCVQVRLYLAGMWRIITVDDYFPVHPHAHTMAFSRALRRQLWVPLIEKALAKVAGCYKALEGGSVRTPYAIM